MPLDWVHLPFEGKAQAILDDIEGLDDAEVQSLFSEWRALEFDPSEPESALSELTRMALDCIARKGGAPTRKERARAALQRRGVIE